MNKGKYKKEQDRVNVEMRQTINIQDVNGKILKTIFVCRNRFKH